MPRNIKKNPITMSRIWMDEFISRYLFTTAIKINEINPKIMNINPIKKYLNFIISPYPYLKSA